jgi:hypothetical protein
MFKRTMRKRVDQLRSEFDRLMVAYSAGDPVSRLQLLAARAALLRDLSRRAHELGEYGRSLEEVSQHETVKVEAELAEVAKELKERTDTGKKVTQLEADLERARAELRKVTAKFDPFKMMESLHKKVEERTRYESPRSDPAMKSS